jgi:putative membrane protein
MNLAGQIFVGLVAIEHLWFLFLEMFLFTKPHGLETFHMTQQAADTCAVLAMNQGLYNGFLSAALIAALITRSRLLRRYGLACVVVAGIYGAFTIGDHKLLIAQALPALVAMALTELGDRKGSTWR